MRTLLRAVATALLGLVAATPAASQDAPPFPAGTSSQTLEGLKVSIVMPDAFDLSKEHSMMVILHGAGGTETGMAGSLAHLAKDDFVVVAPKSKAETWSAADLSAVRTIVGNLRKSLHIGERRLHGAGFSNGGWNLAPVAFDEALRFQSACWIAAGSRGEKPPKHAKKEMGVLALAGGDDPNRSAAEGTVPALIEKVRTAECRIQPGLGHAWPDKLMTYYAWWLGVQEGRFTPGVCAVYEWLDTPAAALEAAAATVAKGSTAKPAGAFVYWYSTTADAASDKAKAFQNDGLRDLTVQRFGQQLPCAKADRDADPDGWAKTGLKSTPALVVYDTAGKVKAAFQDKIDLKAVAAALRSVAPDKSLPKD